MVYVWLLDDLRHEYDAARLSCTISQAMGGKGELPEWSQFREEFDTRLHESADAVADDSDMNVILRGLGLR